MNKETLALISVAFTLLMALTFTPSMVTAWSFCANENGQCNASGLVRIRYGADGKFTYLNALNSSPCNNATFGDPAPGIVKHCHFEPLASQRGQWFHCANEGRRCQTTQLSRVRYGANGSYHYKLVKNSVACNNNRFGDPTPGIVKHCSFEPLEQSDLEFAGSWQHCANEHGKCNISGLQYIRYGADSRFKFTYSSNPLDCNNRTFGDPSPGIVKHCYIKDLRLRN